MIKIIILDDEPGSLKVAQSYFKLIESVEVIGAFTNPIEAIMEINRAKPDVLLLDVEMPQLNGFDVLKRLDNLDSIQVIFMTAYDQYAIQAIKYSALDYLLKPFALDELKIAISKCQNEIKNNSLRIEALQSHQKSTAPKYLVIPGLNEYLKLDLKDIVSAEGQRGGYTVFSLRNGSRTLASKPLSHYQEILEQNEFFKIHKAQIVNLNEVDSYLSKSAEIKMSNDQLLDIAVRRKAQFVKILRQRSVQLKQ